MKIKIVINEPLVEGYGGKQRARSFDAVEHAGLAALKRPQTECYKRRLTRNGTTYDVFIDTEELDRYVERAIANKGKRCRMGAISIVIHEK